MALKDVFRRAVGKTERSSSTSTSSSTSNHKNTNTGGTTTPNTHPGTPLTATSTNNTDPKSTNNNNNLTHAPTITLTKTPSKILSKSLTWRSTHSHSKSSDTNKPTRKEIKAQKALEDWKKQDAEEWSAPVTPRPGKKNQKCQDVLRAFDFKQFEQQDGKRLGPGAGGDERSRSVCSNISPGNSRKGSYADDVVSGGHTGLAHGQQGKLNQQISVDA